MVARYPHTITYLGSGTASVYDEETGTYESGSEGGEVTFACRARPSKPNTTRTRQDGTVQECSFDLGFPKGINPIPEGAICTVKGIRGEILIQAPLIDYLEGNASIRGWI